jgi:diguanylate cyclase (GGDEF)-like protein
MEKLIEIEAFKDHVTSLLSEDSLSRKFLTEQINEIFLQHADGCFYSRLLALFVHLDFEEAEAQCHWVSILKNYNHLHEVLQRKVGLRVAMFDYFLNGNQLLQNPILVEIHLFQQATLMAVQDHLTNLFNRRYFDIALEKEIKRSARRRTDFSLLMIDLDNFKVINDVHGHLFGDKVLKELAAVLKQLSREEDTVCRYGGEEFIVLLPDTTSRGALHYGERVQAAVAENDFLHRHRITFSGGIATFPSDGREAVILLKSVDVSLYQAKFSGKDCIVQSSQERRHGKRYPQTWEFSFQRLEQAFTTPEIHESCTHDVSLNGVKCEMAQAFSSGDKLLLHIKPPEIPAIIFVGKVVWIRQLGSSRYECGLQFHDLKAEQVENFKKALPGGEASIHGF